MKQVIAIIKPFVAERVLTKLGKLGHTDITVREVHGYGRQKSYLSEYQRNEYSVVFLPKIEICVWARDENVDEIKNILANESRTGRMGDGKVLVIDVDDRLSIPDFADLSDE